MTQHSKKAWAQVQRYALCCPSLKHCSFTPANPTSVTVWYNCITFTFTCPIVISTGVSLKDCAQLRPCLSVLRCSRMVWGLSTHWCCPLPSLFLSFPLSASLHSPYIYMYLFFHDCRKKDLCMVWSLCCSDMNFDISDVVLVKNTEDVVETFHL